MKNFTGIQCEYVRNEKNLGLFGNLYRAPGKYQWHRGYETVVPASGLQPLIFDEWRTMETNELLRGKDWSLLRKLKLKGLFAVRSGITNWPLWLAAVAGRMGLGRDAGFLSPPDFGAEAAPEKHLRLGRRPGVAARCNDQETA